MFPEAKAIIVVAAFAAVLLPGISRGEGFTLTQTVSSSLMYESNAALTPTSEKPESDYSLRITPRIELTKETGRSTIMGFYTLTGAIYFRHPDLASITQTAGLDMKTALTASSTLDVSDSFGFSKDIRAISLGGIQVGRGNVLSNSAAVSLSHRFTERSSIGLGLSDALTQINSSAGTTNGRTDTATLSGGFAAAETADVTASYAYSKYFFHSPTERGTTDSHSVLLGITKRFPYSFEVTLSGGGAYTPSLKNSYTALYGGGIKKAFQRSSVAFDYSRSFANTSLLSKLINIDERYTLKWAYKVTEYIDAAASGFYATDRTKPVAEVDLTSWGYAVDGSWRPYSWMTVGLDYTHFTQTAKGTVGEGFKRDDVSLNVTFTAYEGRF